VTGNGNKDDGSKGWYNIELLVMDKTNKASITMIVKSFDPVKEFSDDEHVL
jgi:hypothetical protein